jgi:hypothetical protein
MAALTSWKYASQTGYLQPQGVPKGVLGLLEAKE